MLKFTSEIVDDVLFRAGEPTDGTSDFDSAALDYVNRAYRAIWVGGGEFVEGMNEPWLWLKKDPPGTLRLSPAYTTGSVTVTANSTSITFSAAPADSQAGRFFKVDTFADVFRIVSHTGGAAGATLDAAYTGPSGSGLAFRSMPLEYNLASDVLRLVSPMRIYADNLNEIEGCDLGALERDFPLSRLSIGAPDRFAMVTEASATGGLSKIRVNRLLSLDSTVFARVEYDYLQKPADLTNNPTEEPLVPLEFRQVLADCALYMMYSAKSDARADSVGARARAGLRAMLTYNRTKVAQTGRSTGRIITRPLSNSRFDRALRSTSGFILG